MKCTASMNTIDNLLNITNHVINVKYPTNRKTKSVITAIVPILTQNYNVTISNKLHEN